MKKPHRYGPGVTQEVGLDMASLGAKNVGVYTDSTLVNLPPVQQALDSLTKHRVPFTLYDKVATVIPINVQLTTHS